MMNLTTAGILIWALAWPLLLFPEQSRAALLIAAAAFCLAVAGALKRGWREVATPINGFLALYLLLGAISFILGPDHSSSVRRMTALLLGAAGYLLLITWTRKDPDRTSKLAAAITIAGGILSVSALFMVEWPSRYLVNLEALTSSLPHLTGEFSINHNEITGVLLLVFPLSVAMYLNFSTRWRVIFAVSSLGMMAILILVQSRNAIIALAISVVALAAWGRVRARYVLLVFALLLTVPFIMLALVEPLDTQGVALLSNLDRESKIGPSQDQSWLSRIEIWSTAVKTVADYPVIGSGLYAFYPVSRANYVYQVVQPHVDISHAHNLLLQTGASLGVAGLLTIVGLWSIVLWGLWRTSEGTTSAQQWLAKPAAVGIVGYLVFNIFDVLTLEQRAGLFVWLMLALASTLIALSRPIENRYLWLCLVPLIVYIGMLASPALKVNVARLRLDGARFTGQAPGDDGVFDEDLSGDHRRLGLLYYQRGNQLRALEEWHLDPQANQFLLGQGQRAYLTQDDPEKSIEWYSLSLAIDSGSAQVYYWRGESYEKLARVEEAISDFSMAAELGAGDFIYGLPLDAMAWGRLGQLYLLQNDLNQAEAAFERALSLDPTFSDFERQLEDVRGLIKLID